jgi:TatD DNase family protein
MLPPIDAHAHVQPTVSARDLAGLKACIMAVTRQPSEWSAVTRRNDDMTMWGVGVHPGVRKALELFDERVFQQAVDRAAFIGEVGLDGYSRAPRELQRAVFEAVLRVAGRRPRPVSIHSTNAHTSVLDALRRYPVDAPILHWWLGTPQQTAEAVKLGCFFSVNGAQAHSPALLEQVPLERLLTETDFPHTRKADPAARRPAATGTAETLIARHWGMGYQALRTQLWRNLGQLFDRCNMHQHLPVGVRRNLASVS